MATFNDTNYLTGAELDNYLDELLEEEAMEVVREEDTADEEVPEWLEEEENNVCTCGKPASGRRAQCTMMHFMCCYVDGITGNTGTEQSSAAGSSASTSEVQDSSLCQCCRMLLDKGEFSSFEFR